MRRIVGIVVVFAMVVGACGSDPVDGAESCAELAQVWRDGDQTDQRFRDKVAARVAELEEVLLTRGAGAEAVVCGLFLSPAGAVDGEEFFMEGDSP